MTTGQSLRPLDPIYDERKHRGGIVVGNTPGVVPISYIPPGSGLWVDHSDGNGNAIFRVMYAGGTNWLALRGTSMHRSTDNGDNWSQVAGGRAGSRTTWAWNGSTVVAPAGSSNAQWCRSTNSGLTWSAVFAGPFTAAACGGTQRSAISIAWDPTNAKFMATAEAGYFATSSDGITWSAPAVVPWAVAGNATVAPRVGGGWLLLDRGAAESAISTNGTTFTMSTATPSTIRAGVKIDYFAEAGLYVMVPPSGTPRSGFGIWTSPNGNAWTGRTIDAVITGDYGHGGGSYIWVAGKSNAGGTTEYVDASADGITWVDEPSPFSTATVANVNDADYGNDRIIAVGSGGGSGTHNIMSREVV